MKIKKVEKLVENLHDKKENVLHMQHLKQALSHGLALKKVYRLIKFDQKGCLKLHIDMNPELRKKAKNNFEKDLFMLMNKAVFGKTTQNVRKHRDIKLLTIEARRNYSLSEPNYYTTIFFLIY